MHHERALLLIALLLPQPGSAKPLCYIQMYDNGCDALWLLRTNVLEEHVASIIMVESIREL
jgi:hypothetical protein